MVIEKFCPLKVKGDDRRCDKSLCAWWRNGECAIVEAAHWIMDLTYQAERIKSQNRKKTGHEISIDWDDEISCNGYE